MKAKFDYAQFAFRMRYKLREVASKVGASTSLVGNWNSGVAVPSYEKLASLVELGMTAQEMFGKEIGDLLVKNSSKADGSDRGEIMAAVKAALADLGGR